MRPNTRRGERRKASRAHGNVGRNLFIDSLFPAMYEKKTALEAAVDILVKHRVSTAESISAKIINSFEKRFGMVYIV